MGARRGLGRLLDFEVVALDAHVVAGELAAGGGHEGLAGGDVVVAGVPGALEGGAFEEAFLERAAHVPADGGEAIEGAVDVGDADTLAGDVDADDFSFRDVGDLGHLHEIAHRADLRDRSGLRAPEIIPAHLNVPWGLGGALPNSSLFGFGAMLLLARRPSPYLLGLLRQFDLSLMYITGRPRWILAKISCHRNLRLREGTFFLQEGSVSETTIRRRLY